MDKNTTKFSIINKDSYKRVSGRENKGKDDEFIKFGDDNMYPNYLIDLYNHSAIHASCVNAIVEAIRGEGLVTKDESVLDYANKEGESWNDIYNKVALDTKLFNGFALEVIWSRDRTRIAEVYHIDFSYVRAAKKDYRNNCPGYFVYNDWTKFYSVSGKANLSEVPFLPTYNPYKRDEEPKQIFVYQPYSPGLEYYPRPDYVAATKVIDLDQEVDNFHINNIKNGLTPSLSITTFTNATDDERLAIENMLKTQYQGTNNAGSLLYMDVDAPENAPVITPIPINGADNYYVTINDMVSQKILSAHRITSPALLGIKENVGLGNNADELITAYRLFLNTVVLPFQQVILSAFEDLLSYNNPDISLGVIQKNPLFDNGDQIDVVTSQEADIEDVSGLDDQVGDLQEPSNEENVSDISGGITGNNN
jgi:hypothetical protein